MEAHVVCEKLAEFSNLSHINFRTVGFSNLTIEYLIE